MKGRGTMETVVIRERTKIDHFTVVCSLTSSEEKVSEFTKLSIEESKKGFKMTTVQSRFLVACVAGGILCASAFVLVVKP